MKAQFNNILCATDLSDFSNNAISFGVALAREFGAKLFVCHVVDIPTFSVPSAAYINISDYQNSLVTHSSEPFPSPLRNRTRRRFF